MSFGALIEWSKHLVPEKSYSMFLGLEDRTHDFISAPASAATSPANSLLYFRLSLFQSDLLLYFLLLLLLGLSKRIQWSLVFERKGEEAVARRLGEFRLEGGELRFEKLQFRVDICWLYLEDFALARVCERGFLRPGITEEIVVVSRQDAKSDYARLYTIASRRVSGDRLAGKSACYFDQVVFTSTCQPNRPGGLQSCRLMTAGTSSI